MTRPWAARVLVLVAGVTMNFLLAFVIFTGLFWTGTSPIAVNPLSDKITNSFFIPSLDEAIYYGYVQYDGVEISSVSGSLAEKSGIGTGELIYSINGYHVVHPNQLIEATKQNQNLDLILYKDGGHRVVQITPQDGKIGVHV
jgi:membrane-associated protease RseP (regulator of RpoE activity)